MERSLNVELRPKTLKDFIDCDSIINPIKEGLRQHRVDNTYTFTGPPGTGKTSLARAVAQYIIDTTRRPEDNSELNQYDIEEVPTADMDAESIRNLCARSRNNPWWGKYKAIILDEAQKLSASAMTILLKDLEEASSCTVWFICSSEPGKLPVALMRRGSHFSMPGLSPSGVETLVRNAIETVGGEPKMKYLKTNAYKELVEVLNQQEVTSGGLVIRAVEKFITGVPATEAARTSEMTTFDAFSVAKAAAAGNWGTVQKLMLSAPVTAGRDIRGKVAGYFRSILLKTPINTQRAYQCVRAIELMAELSNQNQFEDGLIMSATTAALYNICNSQIEFKNNNLGPR